MSFFWYRTICNRHFLGNGDLFFRSASYCLHRDWFLYIFWRRYPWMSHLPADCSSVSPTADPWNRLDSIVDLFVSCVSSWIWIQFYLSFTNLELLWLVVLGIVYIVRYWFKLPCFSHYFLFRFVLIFFLTCNTFLLLSYKFSLLHVFPTFLSCLKKGCLCTETSCK